MASPPNRTKINTAYTLESCGNIVFWAGVWIPFDGVEFNSKLSWIDVIRDIGFLVMDLQERGYSDLSAILLNTYLEQNGDYASLSVLRWYIVYRALVRAKVALLRARQLIIQRGGAVWTRSDVERFKNRLRMLS